MFECTVSFWKIWRSLLNDCCPQPYTGKEKLPVIKEKMYEEMKIVTLLSRNKMVSCLSYYIFWGDGQYIHNYISNLLNALRCMLWI